MTELGVSILLVDDSSADIELMLKVLERHQAGWGIKTARDGVEALDLIFGAQASPDEPVHFKPQLVVMDLKMPRLGGFQVLERLKADPRTRDIPVVVLTSSPEHRDKAEASRLGASEYLVKSLTFEGFKGLMQRIVARWLPAETD